MFEDSMIESQKRFKSGRRGATTALSLALQTLLIGIVILIPLFMTQALPTPRVMTQLAAPPPPPPPPPPPAAKSQPTEAHAQTTRTAVVKPLDTNELRVPTKIPDKIVMAQSDVPAAPSVAGVVGGVEGGVPGGKVGGVLGGVVGAAPTLAAPKKVRVSQGVAEGLLTHKVVPHYPPVARQAGVQGSVVLQASISKSGTVQDVQVVSGPPMLAQAAVEAVKQWRYKPYQLNGQPVEVQTTINVNFSLGHSA